jgi:hypothetical protein
MLDLMSLVNQPFFIPFLGTVLIVFVILIFLAYYLRPSQEQKERQFFLKTAKKFEKQLSDLMEKEVKKSANTLNQNTEAFIGQLIEFYGKEISAFPSKMAEQLAQLTRVNKEIQDKLLEETQEKIDQFASTYSEGQEQLFDGIKNKTDELSKNIGEEIHLLYQASFSPLSEKINMTEKNIENYKNEKIKEIDEKIYQIIKRVAKQTLGRTIDLSLHEDLVMDALKKAEKEEFFSI